LNLVGRFRAVVGVNADIQQMVQPDANDPSLLFRTVRAYTPSNNALAALMKSLHTARP
jgi:hypothetical protein